MWTFPEVVGSSSTDVLEWRQRMRVYRRQQDGDVSFEFLDDEGRSVGKVASFLRHLNARGCSPNTASAYAHDLLHFLRWWATVHNCI